MAERPLTSQFPRSGDDLDAVEQMLHQRLIGTIADAEVGEVDNERLREIVDKTARVILSDEYPRLLGDDKEEVIARVVDEVTGLGPIEPLVRDPRVSEVMVNSPDEVYFERDGIIYESDIKFRDTPHIMAVIDRIVAVLGRHVDEASPMVDARLADGSRVNVIIPPLVPVSPVLTIRKFRSDRYTMPEMIEGETVTQGLANFLEGCVKSRLNIVVSGGTGTGKTTFLNALSGFLGSRERIVTIEDPLELRLQQKHVIRMEARPPSTEGRGEVTQRTLFRNALRMRPDRILVGEVRGSEAFDMMQAMNTGHEGSMTTVHANSPRDALARIENMIMMSGFDMPVPVIREQMASALDVIIHLNRLLDGSRKVVQVSEVAGLEGSTVTLQDIFVYHQGGIDAEGRVLGSFRPTGIRPAFTDRLKSFGIELDEDIFGVSRWA
ncbi:MAG TPA: CpaF family protein [Dehalococcoidia bacterium]|nr:CpaF family protein [Dehalococcoidia bacterium]